MASGNKMANTRTSQHRAFYQNQVGATHLHQQARRQQYSDWANGQTDGSEVQLSSSIPQKRSGSSTSLIGTEPGSKRPSIVGPPIPFP